jgi:hypothetical protein
MIALNILASVVRFFFDLPEDPEDEDSEEVTRVAFFPLILSVELEEDIP